jgi:hypothetical protein
MFGAVRQGLYAANPIATSVTGGYALFAGGYDEGTIDSGNRTNIIRKYNLPTDAVSTITATLNAQLDQVCGFANGTKGVLAGGSTGDAVSGVQIITLSDESSTGGQALTVNTLSTRQGRGSSISTAGYMFGGWTTAPVNDIKRYTYSTDTWAYTTNGLGYATALMSIGVHNNATVAKLSGGYIDSTGAPQDIIKSFDFSTESTSTESYSLPAVRAQHCVTGNQTKWMSFAGGGPSFALNTVAETFLFSDGTRTTASALSNGFRMGDAAGDDDRAIIGGGYVYGGTYSTTTNKIYTYSTDTHATASVYLYTDIIDIPGAFHSLQTS